jgi:hypothetical protein
MISASRNRRTEDVRIESIVVAELKFCDVERHVFGTDFVEASYDPALKDRPETLNRIRMGRTDNVLPDAVVNGAVRVIGQPVVDAALVSREQANFVRDGFTNESFSGLFGDVLQGRA